MAKENRKLKQKNDRPEAVTGEFELHFEDVLNRNRFPLVIVITGALVLLALLVPGAVYYSSAGSEPVSIESDQGLFTNKDLIQKIEDDASASSNNYIEFKLPNR